MDFFPVSITPIHIYTREFYSLCSSIPPTTPAPGLVFPRSTPHTSSRSHRTASMLPVFFAEANRQILNNGGQEWWRGVRVHVGACMYVRMYAGGGDKELTALDDSRCRRVCAKSFCGRNKGNVALDLVQWGFQRRGNAKNCPRHFMALYHHWRREFVSGSCELGRRKFLPEICFRLGFFNCKRIGVILWRLLEHNMFYLNNSQNLCRHDNSTF